MDWMTGAILILYIMGVYVAYFQMQEWVDEDINGNTEYQVLFMLSLLSWLVFPIYGMIWLINKIQDLQQ